MSTPQKTNKEKFKDRTGYSGPWDGEEEQFIERLSDQEVDCLIALRDRERGVALNVAAGKEIAYAVGPKAY